VSRILSSWVVIHLIVLVSFQGNTNTLVTQFQFCDIASTNEGYAKIILQSERERLKWFCGSLSDFRRLFLLVLSFPSSELLSTSILRVHLVLDHHVGFLELLNLLLENVDALIAGEIWICWREKMRNE
jgi:hypothetical protein